METSTITQRIETADATLSEALSEALSGRERAILRAVAAGHAELSAGTVPDLYLDGRCCCDQAAAYRLARAGLIAPAAAAAPGARVPAVVTAAGLALAA